MPKLDTKKLHIILLIMGSIFISLSIFHTNLWFDETYSVAIVNHSFKEIWTIGGNDVHPILYYWLLKMVALMTNGSVLAYRIFSCIPIILLGMLGITHIRKDFGEKVGLYFTFLTFFLPITAVYANQIRMYSWAIFILSLFFIYAYRLYKGQESKKNWLCFTFFSICSIYIHYYGLMAAGITNLLLLTYFIKNKKIKSVKRITVFGALQFLLYLPWLWYFIGQLRHVSKGFWIRLHFDDIVRIIGLQMTGNLNIYVGGIIAILCFTYMGKRIMIQKEKMTVVKIASAIYGLVILAALMITIVIKTPILYFRYLYVISGLYIFILSVILAQEKNKYIVKIICTIILGLGISNNIIQIGENYDWNNHKVIDYLKENIEEKDIIIYQNIGLGSIIAVNFTNEQYFYNPENWGVVEAYKAYAPVMTTHTNADFISKLNGRIWIIDTWDEELYHDFFENEHIIQNQVLKTEYYEDYEYDIKLIQK